MPEDPDPSGPDRTVPGLPPLDRVTATAAVEVTDAPGGLRSVSGRWVEGRPVEVAEGPAAADVDVTFTLSAADAEEIASGRLSPSVAYMQGRLKTCGDPGLALQILAATATPGFEQWLDALGDRDDSGVRRR